MIFVLVQSLNLPADDFEQSATMHRDGRYHTVNPAIGGQYDAADQYLRDEEDLISWRIIDYEEYVVA